MSDQPITDEQMARAQENWENLGTSDLYDLLRAAFARIRRDCAPVVTIQVPELTDARFRADVRRMIDQALEQRAPLFDAHRGAVTLGDAPPTEPGFYWYEKGEEKCVTWVEELRPDLDDVSILYAHFGGFMYRLGDPQLAGARWSGRIPEPTS